MGNDIQKGTTYAEGGVGGAGTVNAANLNAHVDESRIKSTFISSKSLKDPASLGDSIVVESGGVLYRETFQQIIDLIAQNIKMPIGAIVDFAGNSPPGGWLLCDGQAINRVTYEELFAVIGTTWGAGDGTNTFNLPELRGFVTAHRDNGAGRLTDTYINNNGGASVVGGWGGSQSHIVTQAEMPVHAHTASASSSGATAINSCSAEGGATQGLQGGGSYAGRVMITRGANEWGVAVSTSVAVNNAGSNGAHNNVQPTRIVNKIIRYQ